MLETCTYKLQNNKSLTHSFLPYYILAFVIVSHGSNRIDFIAIVIIIIHIINSDFICNYLGNEAWTKKFDWSGKADFNNAAVHDWNSGSGVARSSSGLTFLQVIDGK